LVIREISYESILHGFNTYLNRDQKKLFPSYPLELRIYGLGNYIYAQSKAKAILEFNFGEEKIRRHDPCKVVLAHIVDRGLFSLVSGVLAKKKTKEGLKTHFSLLS
jgi:hypothetical protein